MAGLYVYAIVERPLRLRVKGVFRRPLRAIPAASLRAIVESASGPPKATVANLEAQHRIVAALVGSGLDVLPARFGTWLTDRVALETALSGRRAVLVRALNRVRGCVQMTIRITLLRPDPRRRGQARGRTGTAFLRAKAAAIAAPRRDPRVRAISRAAAPFAKAALTEWRDETHKTVALYHLVPRRRVTPYVDAVTAAVNGRQGVTVTGPWAPFAFVGD